MLTEFKFLEEAKKIGQQMTYLSKAVENTNQQLRNLNANISNASASSDRYSSAMKWLTGGLFLAAVAQVAVLVFD